MYETNCTTLLVSFKGMEDQSEVKVSDSRNDTSDESKIW